MEKIKFGHLEGPHEMSLSVGYADIFCHILAHTTYTYISFVYVCLHKCMHVFIYVCKYAFMHVCNDRKTERMIYIYT